MSQRFFRCRVCGQPHEIQTTVCPVHGLAIPSQKSLLPTASVESEFDEATETSIPRPAPMPLIRPSQNPGARHQRSSQPPPAARTSTIEPPARPRQSSAPVVPRPRTTNAPPRPRQSESPQRARHTDPPPVSRTRVSEPPSPPRARHSEPPPAPRVRGSEIPPESQPPVAASAAPLVGETVDGRYHVHGVIAEGGMGVVYDAVHIDLGRRVAIKALARKFAEDVVAVTRFRNEARAASALGHPNIVEVSDMGALPDGAPYLVMERLEGETLGQRVRREGKLKPIDAAQIVAQMLSALTATHEREILHRDLKPENVFLSRRPGLPPIVKLLDFGISKQLTIREDPNHQLTRAGFVMGTPGYMAPEQARGERDLDGRVDLYAVGVLAYEMLSGRVAYTAKNPAALVAEMRNSPPPPLRTLRAVVSDEFELFIHTLMSLDRRQRYASATEALRVLTDPHFETNSPDDEPTVVTAAPAPPEPPPADPAPVAIEEADSSQRVQIFAWNSRRP